MLDLAAEVMQQPRFESACLTLVNRITSEWSLVQASLGWVEGDHVKVVAISVDPLSSHQGWICDINETQGTTMNFPIIADPDRKVATLYDMIHPKADDTFTVRSVFVIGPDRKIKLTLTYPASTGRNCLELRRVIDSLQLTAKHRVATPANWVDGEDCIIVPAVKDEEIPKLFPKGARRVKPYLRYTPQPNR